MSDYVPLSRDPFARSNLVRRAVTLTSSIVSGCQECGNWRHRAGRALAGRLFRYGSIRDDRARVEWHGGYFCLKSCHDAFHGS